MTKTLYKVNSIFSTIQGEGERAGTPSIFVRFGQCNLRQTCWKFGGCDTSFDDFYITETSWIVARIRHLNPHVKDVVLTGGEPTIQYLNELLTELKKRRYFVTLESNGILFPKSAIQMVDLYSVSPKFFNFKADYNPDVQSNIIRAIQMEKKVQIKFVVSTEKDIDFSIRLIDGIIKKAGKQYEVDNPWTVYYQPHETNPIYTPEVIENYKRLIEKYVGNETLNSVGARFALQNHKLIGVA